MDVSDFDGGGVHTDGEDVVVTDVDASDIGEGGRSASGVRGLALLFRYLSALPPACLSFP